MTYLLILPAFYLAVCAFLFFKQDRMLFFPLQTSESELDQVAESVGFAPWRNLRGERIGWQSVEGDPQNALIICHGNGGYALHREYYRDYCSTTANWQVFLLEYPGYGARPGRHSEPSLVAAAADAIDTLAATSARKIWLLGESLGSGVASATVGLKPAAIAGLILITPFNSLAAAAGSHYPWLPVALLLRTRFDSQTNIRHYPGPVAIVIGEDDPIVPPHLGRVLYESYSGQKQLWSVPQAGHNVTGFLSTHWAEITRWLTYSPTSEHPRDYVASDPGTT
ncbi:alpha/beta hydrolase [soil metagenome]